MEAVGWKVLDSSTLPVQLFVHSIGGWLALAGAIVLGPRIGKYGPNGKSKSDPRSQYCSWCSWCIHPLVRLVWFQPRFQQLLVMVTSEESL